MTRAWPGSDRSVKSDRRGAEHDRGSEAGRGRDSHGVHDAPGECTECARPNNAIERRAMSGERVMRPGVEGKPVQIVRVDAKLAGRRRAACGTGADISSGTRAALVSETHPRRRS
jgi:hypothetical protein